MGFKYIELGDFINIMCICICMYIYIYMKNRLINISYIYIHKTMRVCSWCMVYSVWGSKLGYTNSTELVKPHYAITYPPMCPKLLRSTAMWCSHYQECLSLYNFGWPADFLLFLFAHFAAAIKDTKVKVKSCLSRRPHNHQVK